MPPFSAIRVIESTPSRLIVSDPPSYLVGVILLLVVILIATLLFRQRGQSSGVVLWIVLIPLLIGSLNALTSHAELDFSREKNTLTVKQWRFGVAREIAVVPMDTVRNATVETSRGARRLIVVLNSGRVLTPSSGNVRAGYYEAANAINDFLGRHSPR